MKHAGPTTLDLLEPLMAKVRKRPGLTEKKRGSFYRNKRSFLHFHEDPAGLYADLFSGTEDFRLRVSTRTEQRALLEKIDDILAEAAPHANR